MKSIIKTLLIGFILMGCSSVHPLYNELDDAPKWVRTSYIEGYITGIGIARSNKGDDIDLQRTEATELGRNKLSGTIETKAEGFFSKFAQSIGVKDKEKFMRDVKNQVKTVTKQKVKGARVKDSWISKRGNFYVLMILETKSVVNIIKHDIKLKDNDKEFQRFLSEEGDKELEKSLEN